MWAVFDEACRRDGAEREAFVEESLSQDTELLSEVRKLLKHAGTTKGGFLAGAGPVTVKAGWPGETSDPLVGRRFGPYEIQKRLASGGMGSVYLAVRQEDYRQRVAIKVIKRGMDTDDILRRFRSERQVLAGLSHPNIARLLDGGTIDDRPYFVMEYIDGVPIDQYCAANLLNTVGRLRLFLTVCEAVHHAHQNLVVHRDLKPANILVEKAGAPKLVDFGIAKLLSLDPETTLKTTEPGQQPGTLLYASPEQLRGDQAPNTTSDVYALGVVLYELLAGRHPYETLGRSGLEIARMVCEDQPIPLRRRRSDLPRDLEVICQRCLAKSPEDRFPSAAALAEEIGRFLNGEPILSRPVGAVERLVKWARRRPLTASLVAGGATAGGLVIVVILGLLQAAQRERARADVRTRQVVEVIEQVLALPDDEDLRYLPQVTRMQRTALGKAQAQLTGLLAEDKNDPNFRRLQGQLLRSFGSLDYYAGKDDEAARAFAEAEGIQRSLLQEFGSEPEYLRNLVDTLHAHSLLLRFRGRTLEAAPLTETAAAKAEEAVSLCRRLADNFPEEASFVRKLASLYHHQANLEMDQASLQKKVLTNEQSRPQKSGQGADESIRGKNDAQAAKIQLRWDRAQDYLSKGRSILRALAQRDPQPAIWRDLGSNLHSAGYALAQSEAGRQRGFQEIEAYFGEAQDVLEKCKARTDCLHELARLHDSRGRALRDFGRTKEAEEAFALAIQCQGTLKGFSEPKYRRELARHYQNLGDLLRKQDSRQRDAVQAYREALKIEEELAREFPWRPNYEKESQALRDRIAKLAPS
jgi:tetratricopeptide (TPR) repeat protein